MSATMVEDEKRRQRTVGGVSAWLERAKRGVRHGERGLQQGVYCGRECAIMFLD
jgi:hypothetical protein